jgi:hypothetical protein
MKTDEFRNDVAVEFNVNSEMIFDHLKGEYHMEHVGAQKSAEGNTVLEDGGSDSSVEKIT